MLSSIIAMSLRHPWLTVITGVGVSVVAVMTLSAMPVDVFPELNAPTVVIMTESGGLAADEVEQYVTRHIEAAVNGLPSIRRVRSSSAISLSIVWVEFDWGTDLFRARQMVSERLDSVRELLPATVHAEIAPVSSIAGEIMLISLSSPTNRVGPLELRAYAEFELRNRLLAVPGVSQVVAIGGELPEFQINVRQERLALYGLTVRDVVEAAKRSHSVASAGYLANHEGQELPIRQAAQIKNPDDIRRTLVRFHAGRPVTIGDVAEVELAAAPLRGAASSTPPEHDIAGKVRPAVVLSIQKAPGINTLRLTDAVEAVLEQVRHTLPDGMVLNTSVFRQRDFIDRAVDNVMHVLRDAVIIVAGVLVLFLLNLRTTLITLMALPLSLAVTLLIMQGVGLGLNVMTLGGLAVAIGVLVDDAIIDVENVFRRLSENRAQPLAERKPLIRVIYDASNEIRSSIVIATLIICMVFVPLLFLEGLEGRFFRPLGVTYIVSIMASLGVALTVTPALCRLLLVTRRMRTGATPESVAHREAWLARGIKWLYRPTLELALRLRWLVVAMAVGATAATLWVASTFGSSFLPEFNEGTFTVFLMSPPGTSLPESVRLAQSVEQRLSEIPGVRGVARRTGRAERDEHAEPVSSSEIEVTVREGFDKLDVRRAIDAVLAKIPGVTTMVGQPIEHRLSHILSGTPAAIAINVYGPELEILRAMAKEIEAAVRSVPGTRDVNAMREVLIETLPIEYRAEDLRLWGLNAADAAEQVHEAFFGAAVAEVNVGVRRYRVMVRLAADERATPADLEQFVLQGQGGARIRLREVATIGIERASNLIARDNTQRKATISCNVVEGHNLGHLVEAVRAKVDPIVQRYAGYSVHYGGQFEAQQSASRTIYFMGAGVIGAMLALLMMVLGSVRAALIVMLNLPLALIGGIVAIFIAESPDLYTNCQALVGLGSQPYRPPIISIASMVGFVTLFGIAVRNGILLGNRYMTLLEQGHSLDQAIRLGSHERLIAILMTALCAALGLLPLAMAAGEPGSELLAPLSIVVLGGLLSSTVLNLVVVPAAFALFGPRTVVPPDRRLADEGLPGWGDSPRAVVLSSVPSTHPRS